MCGFSPQWINSCCFKKILCVNALLHFEQACGFLPVWKNMFSNVSFLWMSCYILSRHVEFLNCGSICGFSNYPPGRMSWHILSRHEAFLMRQNMASLQCGSIDVFFKVPYCMNVLSHFEQTCGFLTVRISSCVFKYAFCVNVFSHFEQACGFSPVWITSYFFKCVFC